MGCWAKGRGVWGAGIPVSTAEEIGLEWWSEEVGISEDVVMDSVRTFWVFLGGFWISFLLWKGGV